jgi:hypothetical protein
VDFRLKDGDREQQRRQPHIRYSPIYSPHFRVWSHDLDGDGTDELIVLTNDSLQVLAGDLSGVRWEWPLPDTSCELLAVYPAAGDRPATLVVRADSQVLGLAGTDGRVLWSCAGSGKPRALLPADTLETRPGVEITLPRVVFDLGDQATVCRRALPAGDLSAARGFAPYTPPGGEDLRYVRPLPWNAVEERLPLVPASLWGIALALGVLTLAVVVVPGWLWWRLLLRRRWLLALLPFAWLALAWAVVCVLYLALLSGDASFRVSQSGWWGFIGTIGLGALVLAPVGLPFVAAGAAAWRWLRCGQWQRLAAAVLLALALAGVAAWVWLHFAAPRLDDDQQFSHQGWLGIVPAGVYLVGVLLLAGWLMVRLFRLVRAVGRRLRPAVN